MKKIISIALILLFLLSSATGGINVEKTEHDNNIIETSSINNDETVWWNNTDPEF